MQTSPTHIRAVRMATQVTVTEHKMLGWGRTIMFGRRNEQDDGGGVGRGEECGAYGSGIEKGAKFLRIAGGSRGERGLGGSGVGTGINPHPDFRKKAVGNVAGLSGQQLEPAEDMRW